jgi:predicted nicotinamide N-methyase
LPRASTALDARAFIRARLPLLPVRGLPELRLHQADSGSGLSRATVDAPYWAYVWAGGAALARYILDRPQIAAGRRVLDLGAGSGVVGIAAAIAGAREIVAVDVDPVAIAAVELNAAANGVTITGLLTDLLAGPPFPADLVLAGDLFYDPDLADRAMAYLERCAEAGASVLIGDPERDYLPRARLRELGRYTVIDFGDGKKTPTEAAVFVLEPA